MEEVDYYLTFSHCQGIGPVTFDALIREFGDVATAYQASETYLLSVVSPLVAHQFFELKNKLDLVNLKQNMQSKQIYVVHRASDDYPPPLRHLKDAPICLYFRGNFRLNWEKSKVVAIVGTRKATGYGQVWASRLARELAQQGVIVVSGMAIGIDAYSHEGALEGNGITGAVLGCGVDMPYPRHNQALYHQILQKNGFIMSEFPPGMYAQKGLFVSRNRLISGLADATVVIEGTIDSGSLITGRCAAEQGKEVFALPGVIDSELSAGPHHLIKEGAQILTSVDDILHFLHLTSTTSISSHLPLGQLLSQLNDELERQLVSTLYTHPQSIDELAQSLDQSVTKLLPISTQLEMLEMVQKKPDGRLFLP